MADRLSTYLNYLPAVYQQPEITGNTQYSVAFLSHYLTIFEKIFSGIDDATLEGQKGIGEVLNPEVIGNLFYPRFSFLFPEDQAFIPPLDTKALQEFAQYIPPLNLDSKKFNQWLANFINWLASWAALVLDQTWDVNKKRLVLAKIIPIYRSRGTLAGLQQLLDLSIEQGSIISVAIKNAPPVPPLKIDINIVLYDTYTPGNPIIAGQRPWLFMVDITPNSDASQENIITITQKALAIIDQYKPEFSYYQVNILNSEAAA